MSPVALKPPYPYNYTIPTDRLYDDELRLAMQRLNDSALEPLPTPSMSLLSCIIILMSRDHISLAKLKQLPLSLLASLVIRNLSHPPRVLPKAPDDMNDYTSLKREFLSEDGEKRSRRDSSLHECEEISEPNRLSLQELILQSLLQHANNELISSAPQILCNCAVSLLSICDNELSDLNSTL